MLVCCIEERRQISIRSRRKGTLDRLLSLQKFTDNRFAQFDATLRARTPEFGLRNLDDIVALAEAQGLKLISEEALGGGTNLFLQFQFRSSE